MNTSVDTVLRWLENYNTFGIVLCPNNHGGRPRIIDRATDDAIVEFYRLRPSAYLNEVKSYLAVTHDIKILLSALHLALDCMGLSRKVLLKPAAERDEGRRRQWRAEIEEHFTPEQLVFGDKVSVDTRNLRQNYGRSRVGHRAVQRYVQAHGQRWSMITVLGLDGCVAARAVPGMVNGLEFFDFVISEVLANLNPYPHAKSVLVLNNCAIHKAPALQQAIEAAGCVLRFLPPYSPDLNPIEESFSALKSYLPRHDRQYMHEGLTAAGVIEAYVTTVTPDKCIGWYADSGYTNL